MSNESNIITSQNGLISPEQDVKSKFSYSQNETIPNKFPTWEESYPYPKSDSDTNLKIDKGIESDLDDDWDSQPRGERWQPLGAPNDDEQVDSYCRNNLWDPVTSIGNDADRLKELEEEQEQLNSSLLALTSHFAQVQFRLKQIVDASAAEKENLLVELEEFANRGIPDVRQNACTTPQKEGSTESRLDIGQERQKELIEQLKQQLEDLEDYAYQTGEAGLPQSVVLQKQRVIIDQLKGKLNLNVDDIDKLTIEDLKHQVDNAVKELVNPLRMKEQLVTQLQTQIVDLERFIEFLQDADSDPFENIDDSKCKCDGHVQPEVSGQQRQRRNSSYRRDYQRHQLNKETDTLVNKATTLLHMLTFAQLGCGPQSHKFKKNNLKKTATGCHWGDLRAVLEVSIANIVELAGLSILENADCSLDAEQTGASSLLNDEAITQAVRKKLTPALRDLIQHGLMPVGQSTSLVPFLSCFPQRSQKASQMMHAWDFILKYYQQKKGDNYNKTPARKLSQSFNLEITGGSAITNKELLLQTIGHILTTHSPLKRSYDSHFKAFICAALNKKKLVVWLRLIFRTQSLVESYYQSWSYVAKTGFEDAFRSLDQLSKFDFDLSVDLAVKPFHNIKDVF